MKHGFLNQKLGKRNSRRAELQRAKNELARFVPVSKGRGPSRNAEHRTPSGKSA